MQLESGIIECNNNELDSESETSLSLRSYKLAGIEIIINRDSNNSMYILMLIVKTKEY